MCVSLLDPVVLFLSLLPGKKPMIMPRRRHTNVIYYQLEKHHWIVCFSFLAGPDDTLDNDLKAVTFEPKLMTVAEELMQVNGIVETKKRGPVYIY